MRSSNEEAVSLFFGMENLIGALDGDSSKPSFWDRNVKDLPGARAVSDFLRKQIYVRIWRFAWLDQSQHRYLRQLQQLLDFVRAAQKEKSLARLQPAVDRLIEDSRNQGFYDRLRFPVLLAIDSLSKAPGKAMRAETERSLVLAAIALKRYTLRNGKLPVSLDALVPDILPAAPIDYMDGRAINYSSYPDGTFRLYSVGENAKDDGGDPALLPGKTGVGNWWNRKDTVWPASALPEEITHYRKAGKPD